MTLSRPFRLAVLALAWVTACGAREEGGAPKASPALQEAGPEHFAVQVLQSFPVVRQGGSYSGFGTRVAVSGNLAVVGAPYDSNPLGRNTGAAYILERQANNSWTVKQKLTPPVSMIDDVAGQAFGSAVAIEGETIFVGAPATPRLGLPRGMVHVYEKQTENGQSFWYEDWRMGQATTNWPVEGEAATRGQWRHMGPISVKPGEAWTFNLNGDGDADLYVATGAPASLTNYYCRPYSGGSIESCGGNGLAQHYIGVRGYASYSTFALQATLPPSSITQGQTMTFGPFTAQPGQRLRVQTTGTGDPDLRVHQGPTMQFGADDCSSGSWTANELCVMGKSGEFYVSVYGYSAGTFTLQVFFEPLHEQMVDGGDRSMIGSDIAVKAGTVAIAGRGATGGGSVRVARKIAGVWTQEALLRDPKLESGAHFGAAVATDGNRIVASVETATERVHLFERVDGVWGPGQEVGLGNFIPAFNPGPDEAFGRALAIDGDRLLVGAPDADSWEGKVYVFDWTGDRWTRRADLRAPGYVSGGFGSSLAIHEGQVAVGVPYYNGVGAVYLYSNVGSTEPTIYEANNTSNAWASVGTSVALAHNVLLAGAPYDGDSEQGGVFTISPYADVCATLANGMPCEDGNACTLGDFCQQGTCQPGSGTRNCDDGQQCTADSCHPQIGCVNDTKVPELQGWACNKSGCGQGTCSAGACATLTDSNPMCQLEPTLACVLQLTNGNYRAVFGYKNNTQPGANVSVAPGTNISSNHQRNYLSSGQVASDQPTWLEAGDHPVAFTVDLTPGDSVTWHLGDKSRTAVGQVVPGCSSSTYPEGQTVTVGGMSYLVAPNPAGIAATAKVATKGALGPLAGQGQVGPDGSYSYSVPIWTPPGVNGMQPSLSLNYSSGGGNGLLGVGWSLSGFSKISRCPKTQRVAGEVAPIKYEDNEQFCLDGNPLVWSSADGFYRTRAETFVKVVKNGSGTSMSWTVHRADGTKSQYQADGAIKARQLANGTVGGSVAPSWWITSTVDRFGNSVSYEYSTSSGPDANEESYTLERHPAKVRYSGPNFSREIAFSYKDRPQHDWIESYVMGLRYVTTKLLESVSVRVKDEAGTWSTVKQYRLGYHMNGENSGQDWSVTSGRKSISGRSLLQSLQECDGEGTEASCGPPTTFDWESGSWAYEKHTLNLPSGALLSFADVNDDGKEDLIMGELVTHDICPPGGGEPNVTQMGKWSFETDCAIPRPDGTAPYYTNSQFWGLCHPLKASHCTSPLVIKGTQLCDAYSRKDYKDDYSQQEQNDRDFIGGCEVIESRNKWARYHYVLNDSRTQNGVWTPSFGNKAPLVDKYFVAHGESAADLRAPLVVNVSGSAAPEVVTQEFERLSYPSYPHINRSYSARYGGDRQGRGFEHHLRYNLQVWPLGAHADSQLLFTDHIESYGAPYNWTPPRLPLAIATGDLDGDGRTELVYARGGETSDPTGGSWVAHRVGQGQTASFGAVAYKTVTLSEGKYEWLVEEAAVIDWDGDGAPGLTTWFADGSAGGLGLHQFPRALHKRPTFVDVNGDGLLDALDRGTDAESDRHFYINSGLRAAKAIKLTGVADDYTKYLKPRANNMDDGIRVADFDGDGRSDVFVAAGGLDGNAIARPTILLRKGNTLRTVRLYDSSGVAFSPPDETPTNLERPEIEHGILGWRQVYVVDIDGDGLPDIVQREGTGFALYRRSGKKPDMLKTINNGVSSLSTTSIEYAPISDASANVYTPVDCNNHQGVPCSDDQINVSSGMWVVKRVTSDAGMAGSATRSSSYKYFDARVDRRSGAFLGFRKFRVIDDQRNSWNETEILFGSSNQHTLVPSEVNGYGFVFAGRPRREEAHLPGVAGENITISNHEYEFVSFAGGKTGLVRAKKRTQGVFNPRQSACHGLTSVVEMTYEFVPPSEPGGMTSEIKRETATKRPDASCNVQGRTHAVETVTKEYTYWPEDVTSWTLGLVRDVKATTTVDGVSLTKSSTTEWNSSTRVPSRVIQQPDGGADQRLETVYGYDSRGLAETVTTKAAGQPDRVQKTTFDSYGFPRVVTNQLGHETEAVADPASGTVVWSRDMNGNITRKKIDRFFREVEVEVPNGPAAKLLSVTAYQSYSSSWAPLVIIKETQLIPNGGSAQALSHAQSRLDRHGREVWTAVRNSKGQLLTSSRTYDLYGRLQAEQVPFVSTSEGSTTYEYDELDRVVKVTAPDLAETRTSYWDLTTTVTDPDGKVSESVTDTLGRLVQTRVVTPTGAHVGVQRFTYRPDGLLSTSTDSAGVMSRIEYDALGRRTLLVDPDTGATRTYYNAFGEVRLEEDSLGVKTTFVRDVLGRTLEKRVEEPLRTAPQTPARVRSTFQTWDTAPNGVGQLHTVASYDGVVQAFAYDDLGRVVAESTARAGKTYTFRKSYDVAGRLQVVEYPEVFAGGGSGTPGSGQRTRVRYAYSGSDGSLSSISNAQTNAVYWRARERTDQNQIKREVFGNGAETTRAWDAKRGWMTSVTTTLNGATLQNASYAYTAGGLLRNRADTQAPGGPLTETFRYDALNRLEWWCLKDVPEGSAGCGSAPYGVRYAFSDNGNLTERRVVAWGNAGAPLENVEYTYPSATTPQPHGVRQRRWTSGGGATVNFAYDSRGRQWQRPGQTIWYNDADLPEKIESANGTTTYLYDAGGARFQKKTVLGANLTRTTTYVGVLYEMREETGTAATLPRTHVFYVMAGGTAVAQITRSEPDLSDVRVEYMHNDHLGSVSFTTSQAGVASPRVMHDPYGNRFDPGAAPRLDRAAPAGIGGVTRGYTGHEMEVDDLGVINMRGRIFDPMNARFLSADPLVQSPSYSQSYNRYMYVFGNPMMFTDPTGYLSCPTSLGCEPRYHEDEEADRILADYDATVREEWFAAADAWGPNSPTRPDGADRGAAANQFDQHLDDLRTGRFFEMMNFFASKYGVSTDTARKFYSSNRGMFFKLGFHTLSHTAGGTAGSDAEGLNPGGSDILARTAAYGLACGPGCDVAPLQWQLESLGLSEQQVSQTLAANARGELGSIIGGGAVMAGVAALLSAPVVGALMARLGLVATRDAPRLLGPVTKFAPKIEGQLAKRGWSKESVERLIGNPSRTAGTRDTRFLPGGGRMNDPATAFINSKGHYVVRNDVTGDVVQISNKFDVNWVSPF